MNLQTKANADSAKPNVPESLSKKHPKTIRSFVRREGRMTDGQKKAWKKYWLRYGLDFTGKPIDILEIFKKKQPLVLEIGFGMGDFLATLAVNNPNQNFIGIEVYRPGVGSLLITLVKKNINNVRIFCADAIEVLEKCIPDKSLDEIFILFPDPWPKKRHHKRRLIQMQFIELIYAKLKPNGYLHIATDWENYARHIKETMSKNINFVPVKPKQCSSTKFEKRARNLNHQIWDFGYRAI